MLDIVNLLLLILVLLLNDLLLLKDNISTKLLIESVGGNGNDVDHIPGLTIKCDTLFIFYIVPIGITDTGKQITLRFFIQ